MSWLNDNFDCCGITELADINDGTPEEHLMNIDYGLGIVVFSDVHSDVAGAAHGATGKRYKDGLALASLIKKLKLGSLVCCRPVVNPNTHNSVKMWTWCVNMRALKTWQRRMKKKDPDTWSDHDPYYNEWRRND